MKRTAIFTLSAILCLVGFTFGASAAEPNVTARSAVLINAATGTVLFEKNADEQRAMASTTKIMTALLTIEAGGLDDEFVVDDSAIMVEGTTMGLTVGDIVTRRALCLGMLLPSGNDAANAAAVSVSGSIQKFVELMNSRAEKLGMTATSFQNPHGLDAEGHYSTARDMAILAAEALRNPTFAEMCRLTSAKTEFGNPPYTRWLKNNNKLLHNYGGCIGMKTGFTDNARRCLVSAAERDGARLIAVTLNAPDDWRDHASMLDYGFTLLKKRVLSPSLSALGIGVVGGETDRVKIRLEAPLSAYLTDTELLAAKTVVSLKPFLYAGFSEGTEAGTASVLINGKIIVQCGVYTADGCAESGESLGFAEELIRRFTALF